MATLRWDRVTWEEFLEALQAYKQHTSTKSREDFAYLRCQCTVDWFRCRYVVERWFAVSAGGAEAVSRLKRRPGPGELGVV